MSPTDFLGINDHKLFKQLSKTFSADCNKTLNIIAERHNVLYAWNKEDNSVLTLNIKAVRENEESALRYQTLLPHSPPYFAPERLLVNETNTILIVAGPHGVLLFEIPERSPPCGNFSNNKEVIYCRTYSLLENILSFSSTVEVRQVRFHPGSPTDSHVVVLTSDNVIRLFSLSNSTVSDVGSYSLGPKPTSKLPDRNLSFLDALGDLAVDFDFSSPTIEASKLQLKLCSGRGDDGVEDGEEDLMWPVFILYGNGLVCKIMMDYSGEKNDPGLYGPLNFNNFPTGNLSDFCSILCIPTTPPVVVIAHCDGNLYHALELPSDDQKEETQESTSESSAVRHNLDHKLTYSKRPNTELFLIEVIEVELGLAIASSNAEAQNYTCPIFLERDLSTLGSYYATHNTGVHCVYIHAVEELNLFVNKDDEEVAPEGIFTKPSTAEYIICTRPSPTEKVNPVVGISVFSKPHALITVLANGNVLTLPVKDALRTVLSIVDEQEEQSQQNLNLSSAMINQNTPFDVYISNILKQSTSQPILKADTNETEPPEEVCYEILERACKIFREEHFVNLTKAREEIETRSKQLKVLQEIQFSELNNMQNERQALQTSAENIAEKYEDLKEKQEEISKRCQMLLVLLSRQQIEPSIAEEKYFEKLDAYDKQIDGFIVAIEKLKNKMKYQRNQMVNWKRENQKPDPLLPGQNKVIRQNLTDTTKKIADIAAEVKIYMNKLNIR